jgi:transposase InsO family protein
MGYRSGNQPAPPTRGWRVTAPAVTPHWRIAKDLGAPPLDRGTGDEVPGPWPAAEPDAKPPMPLDLKPILTKPRTPRTNGNAERFIKTLQSGAWSHCSVDDLVGKHTSARIHSLC